MAAPAFDLDANLHAAAVAAVDVHVCRLGDDDEFGLQLLDVEQVLPTKAVAILLHDRGGEEHRELVVQPEFLDEFTRVNHRGDAALLVHRAAPPNLPGLHEWLERIELPSGHVAGINRVHVAVKGNHALALADAADDVAKPVNLNAVKADGLHLLFDDGDDVLLLGRKRLRADEVGEKAHGVFLHRLGALLYKGIGDGGGDRLAERRPPARRGLGHGGFAPGRRPALRWFRAGGGGWLRLGFRFHRHILCHKSWANSRARALIRASSRFNLRRRFSISTRPPTMVVSAGTWETPKTRWPATFSLTSGVGGS